MSQRRGWWKLKITNIDDLKELSDCDREHIAKCIIDGYTSGEILQEDSDEEIENEEVNDTPLKELPLLIGSLDFESSIDILEKKMKNEQGP